MAGGRLDVWSIFSLRSRPTYSIRGGHENRVLGGFGGNRPDIRRDRRAQESVVDPAMVVFRPRNSCYWRRCCRRSLRNRGLPSRPHPLIPRQHIFTFQAEPNTLTPSMRRPIPVESFCCFGDFLHFPFTKPPLSPPFHPHSEVSAFRSVPVRCSRFSRCCYLISVLCFRLTEGSLGQELVVVI